MTIMYPNSIYGSLCIVFLRFYLFIHRNAERERGPETQAEGEADSMPGARRGTRSRDSIPGLQDYALGQRQAPNR